MKEVQNMLKLNLEDGYCFNNADVMLVNSGVLLARPKHDHTFYEFFLVESGNAIHTVNDHSYVIEKGDLVMIRPRDAHAYSFYETRDFHVINVPLTVSDVEALSDFIGLDLSNIFDPALPRSVRLDSAKLSALSHRLRAVEEMKHGSFRGAYLRLATMDVLLALLTAKPTSDELPNWMKETVHQLEKNIDTPEEFESILAQCERTKEHVCRTFRRYLGTTPTKYCIILRLRRAGELLRTTDLSINEIRRRVGFNRENYFYKCFNEYYHMTPLEYRRSREEPAFVEERSTSNGKN